jgi:hypothetical protein
MERMAYEEYVAHVEREWVKREREIDEKIGDLDRKIGDLELDRITVFIVAWLGWFFAAGLWVFRAYHEAWWEWPVCSLSRLGSSGSQ